MEWGRIQGCAGYLRLSNGPCFLATSPHTCRAPCANLTLLTQLLPEMLASARARNAFVREGHLTLFRCADGVPGTLGVQTRAAA